MLNSNAKKTAVERLERAAKRQNDLHKKAIKVSDKLYELRRTSSERIIRTAEVYVSKLANSPKEFTKEVARFRVERQRFDHIVDEIASKANKVEKVAGGMAGAGAAAGVGVAALAPSAMMAVATTFGTASTGTAISALSGAAATNAALAWLGGGALAAGGGGMAGGSALLAMAGPVGIGIGVVALGGGVFIASNKNKQIAKQATEEALKAEAGCASLMSAIKSVNQLHRLTKQHADGADQQLGYLSENSPSNYTDFNNDQKMELAALINNIRSLSNLLNKKAV